MPFARRAKEKGDVKSTTSHAVYNDCVEQMRKSEYPMLQDLTYLDHGGTTLASKSLLESFCNSMQRTLLANPHSDSSNPSASSVIVENTRQKVLKFFNADPEYFDVVFTANATAAIKLVLECFSGHDHGFDYYFHRNCHTSLVGGRELARTSQCLRSNHDTEEWLLQGPKKSMEQQALRPTLFAYPAQSNMNGERLPLSWSASIRQSMQHLNTFTLLDAAAYVSTSPLDLGDHTTAPDFISLSFYKIFGFPDLGALIVRKASAHVLSNRKYFGGGTTDMITVLEDQPWFARKQASIHARLEDGTIAIRSILALSCAFDTHQQLFGTMRDVASHTGWLASTLHERLSTLRHPNGTPVCCVYQALESRYGDATTQGATIALNVQRSDKTWMSAYNVGSVLRKHNIHVRTGGLCNPAGMADALNLTAGDIREAYDAGFRCNQQNDIRDGRVMGMVRITFGAMSTMQDVHAIMHCFGNNLVDKPISYQHVSLKSTTDSYVDLKEKLDMPRVGASKWRKKAWRRLFSCFGRTQLSNSLLP